MFKPYQVQDESKMPLGFDELTNHVTANGTGWWLDRDEDAGMIRVSSFKGGPVMATFATDMAEPESDAIAEIVTELRAPRE